MQTHVRQRHWRGLGIVAGSWVALFLFRHAYVEPREWGAVCAAASPPFACGFRAALLWMQYQGLWGGTALALGIWAFVGAPFGATVAAVALGIAGVVNYNATFGMLGAALGAFAWITSCGSRGATAARP